MVSKRDLQTEITQIETLTIPKLMELDKAVKELREQLIKSKKSLIQIFDHLDKMLQTSSEHATILQSHSELLHKLAELASEQYVPPKKKDTEDVTQGYA